MKHTLLSLVISAFAFGAATAASAECSVDVAKTAAVADFGVTLPYLPWSPATQSQLLPGFINAMFAPGNLTSEQRIAGPTGPLWPGAAFQVQAGDVFSYFVLNISQGCAFDLVPLNSGVILVGSLFNYAPSRRMDVYAVSAGASYNQPLQTWGAIQFALVDANSGAIGYGSGITVHN